MKKLIYTLTYEGSIDLEDDIEYTEGQIMSLVREKYYVDGVDLECNYRIEEE